MMKKIVYMLVYMIFYTNLFSGEVDIYTTNAYYNKLYTTQGSEFYGDNKYYAFSGNLYFDKEKKFEHLYTYRELNGVKETKDEWKYFKFFLPKGIKQVRFVFVVVPVTDAVMDMKFVPYGTTHAVFDHTGFGNPFHVPQIPDAEHFITSESAMWNAQGTMRYYFNGNSGVFIDVDKNMEGWFYVALAEGVYNREDTIKQKIYIKVRVSFTIDDLSMMKESLENAKNSFGIPKNSVERIKTVYWAREQDQLKKKEHYLTSNTESAMVNFSQNTDLSGTQEDENQQENTSSTQNIYSQESSNIGPDGCPHGKYSEINEEGKIRCIKNPLADDTGDTVQSDSSVDSSQPDNTGSTSSLSKQVGWQSE